MASDTGGVTPMSIRGRMARERERLEGMTDDERMWRKNWLKDQELAHNEPLPYTHAQIKERYNPIRRFYRFPLDCFETAITPMVGSSSAFRIRWATAKLGFLFAFVYSAGYYFKYNGNDWSTKSGWRVVRSKSRILPQDCHYPYVSKKDPSDFADGGFKQSIFANK